MKLRVFTARGSNWSWNLDIEPLQREINEWFGRHFLREHWTRPRNDNE